MTEGAPPSGGPMRPPPSVPLRGRPALWALFAAAALALPGVALWREASAEKLPVLGALPDFRLIDQKGRPFGKQDLAGHTWAASFVYTRCSAACPMLTAKMKRLQDRIDAEGLTSARLVSFSVDPERDRVEELRGYADGFGAKDETWRFLTGDLVEIERVVVQGFKIAMGKVPATDAVGREPAAEPSARGSGSDPGAVGAAGSDDARPMEAFEILHGEKLVLVDSAGRIRGYYDADDAGLAALMDGLRALSREPRS